MKRKCTILLFIICIFCLTGCSSKRHAITIDEFEQMTNQKEYYFLNTTENFQDDSMIQEAGLAYTAVWQIEFYVLDTEEDAITIYQKNITNYEDLKDTINTYSLTEKTYRNGETYSLTTNTKYLYVSRIDRTVLFIYVPVEYRSKVSRFAKDLGY